MKAQKLMSAINKTNSKIYTSSDAELFKKICDVLHSEDLPSLEQSLSTLSINSASTPRVLYFIIRTLKHIARVQANVIRLVNAFPQYKQALSTARQHDIMKFQPPEVGPYISLTQRHKNNNTKYMTPGLLSNDEENKATIHHILNNGHHPEFWAKNKEEVELRPNDRSETVKIVDATAMTEVALLEMVADWAAMSQELKTNSTREWFDKVNDTRFSFSDEQKKLINEFINSLE